MTFIKTNNFIKAIALPSFLLLASFQAQAETTLSSEQEVYDYFLKDNYSETWANGSSSIGYAYSSCDEIVENERIGDKIKTITTYSDNTNYLKGMILEYESGNTYKYGKMQSSGGNIETLDIDEHITGAKVWRSRSKESISRIDLYTKFLDSGSTGRTLSFGNNNQKKNPTETYASDQVNVAGEVAFIGMYGQADTDRLWGLGFCTAPVSKLEFDGLEIDYDAVEIIENDIDLLYSKSAFTNKTNTNVSFSANVGHEESTGISDYSDMSYSTTFTTGLEIENSLKAGALGTGTQGGWKWSVEISENISYTVGDSKTSEASSAADIAMDIDGQPWKVYAIRMSKITSKATVPYVQRFVSAYDSTVYFESPGTIEDVIVSYGSGTAMQIGEVDPETHDVTLLDIYADEYYVDSNQDVNVNFSVDSLNTVDFN